ncbi:MAG: hypothetical protein C4541_03675 [Candidatus Auribacter fodinae]|jgi:hypothetical protein|uniref:Uncharacterized protein n=1 Tax=Candidatus Auribacter fodinae TaxID=2093366 RepID=A0A3A4RD00_9BACT|nr:MAG: hypothetical protein C4541_03675 [Candidatus Auribacter fodinae]
MRKYQFLILFLLVAAAFVLRLWHIDFGLPELYHPDERIATDEIGRFVDGDFSVKRYNHPPLIKYAAYAGLTAVTLIKGYSPEEQKARITLFMRFVSLLSGTAIVAVLFFAARAFLSFYQSILCCALYTFIPMNIFLSKYGAPDALLSFFFLLAVLLQIRMLTHYTKGIAVLNGLFFLLAVAAKYNAVFLVIPFTFAHFIAVRRAGQRLWSSFSVVRLLLFCAGSFAGCFIGFITLFLGDWKYLFGALQYERQHLFAKGHYGLTITGWDYFYCFHFIRSILPETGLLFTAGIFGGIIILLAKKNPAAYLLLLAIVPYYVVVESVYKVPVVYQRYILPLMGLYCISCCLFFDWVSGVVGQRLKADKTQVFSVLLILVMMLPAYKSVRYLSDMYPDTRMQMKSYLKENVPAGKRLLIEWPGAGYYPYLFDRYRIVTKPQLRLLSNADYVLASSLMYDRYFDYPDELPEKTHFYKFLFQNAELIYIAKPEYETYLIHNPELRLYATQNKRTQNARQK